MQRAQVVLHIRQTAGAASDAVEARARQSGAAIRSLTNVYTALALIGSSTESIDLVVVDVDGLGDAELEFFAVAPRVRTGCSVYVYSASGDQSRVVQACANGTTRELTEESLTLAVCSEPSPANRVPPHGTSPWIAPAPATIVPPPVAPPPSMAMASAPAIDPAPNVDVPMTPADPRREPASPRLRLIDEPATLDLSAVAELNSTMPVEHGTEIDEARSDDQEDATPARRADDGEIDHPEAESDAEPNAVRVPWLRYPGPGVRTPPGSAPAGDNGAGTHRRPPIPHEGRTPVPRESLLTEEELAALLEDDEPHAGTWPADNGARP